MPQFFTSLSNDLRDWALSQPVFFVASSPRYGIHVNISPKGLPATTFTVLDPNTACYIDATGSGAETISHLYETGRITVMFCSFEKSPRIMRFFCKGRVVEFDAPEYETLLKKMGKEHVSGARAVIVLDIFKVQTSCGYGVPLISSDKSSQDSKLPSQTPFLDRETLGHWASKQVEKGEMETYRAKNNAYSLDNLPGLKAARRSRGENLLLGDTRACLMRLRYQWDAVLIGMVVAVVVMVVIDVGVVRDGFGTVWSLWGR